MQGYKWNPKVKGSGIITCIPQEGICPNKCEDCFFQSGRSYLEPLKENLPHIPPVNMIDGRIVRMNDGNDSNVERAKVKRTARHYPMHFYNTATPTDLAEFDAPVVLTINPGKMTNNNFWLLTEIPNNLMFVRIRVNMWNWEEVLIPAVKHYTELGVVVVFTFMAYYKEGVPENYARSYTWKQRTLNSYWVLNQHEVDCIMAMYNKNPFVYSCGVKGRFECMFCGNCVREYYNALERMRGVSERIIL